MCVKTVVLSVLRLWILVRCSTGYVIVQNPVQYNDHQSYQNEHQWQPLQYNLYDYPQHGYQTYGYQSYDYKPYEYQAYGYQPRDDQQYYDNRFFNFGPSEFQPYDYQPVDYQPYEPYQPYNYRTNDYKSYTPYNYQPYSYQNYHNSYSAYYPRTFKYPEPYKRYQKSHDQDISYDEGQKFLQLYRLIRVIVTFRTIPKYQNSLLDKLLQRLTKQSLQEQLVELVCHVDGYEDVAALEREPHGTELEMFVDDTARLLPAIQKVLNALDLDGHDHGCCELHEHLCEELRQLRDQANALSVPLIKKERVHHIKAMVKQALDSDILEDLDEDLESKLLDLDHLNIDVAAIPDKEEVQNIYGDRFYSTYQTPPTIEVDFGEMAAALELQLEQHLITQFPQKKSQEGLVPIEKTTSSITNSIPATRMPQITTEKAKESLGPAIEKDNPLPSHQTVEISKPVAITEPTVTEAIKKLKEANLWVNEDIVVQNVKDIDRKFQQSISTDKSGIVWPHSVPLWLVDKPKPQEIVIKDQLENKTENAVEIAVDEAKLQLVSKGVDDSLANYDVFADLIEHEAESFTPEASVVDVQTEPDDHKIEQNLTTASVTKGTSSDAPFVYETPPKRVSSESPTIQSSGAKKVQHFKHDELAEDFELNIGELIVTKSRLGPEEESRQLLYNTVTAPNPIVAAESQNTTEGVRKSWFGSLFGQRTLLPVRQTIEDVTQPAEIVEPVIEGADQIDQPVVVTHDNVLANNSLEFDSALSPHAPETTSKKTSSVPAVFNSVASWFRKSPDQNLESGGTLLEVTDGKARSFPDDGIELEQVVEDEDSDHSETESKSESVLIDEKEGAQQISEQRSLGASNEDTTPLSISELQEARALAEYEEVEIPLPFTDVPESDVLGFVEEEAKELDTRKDSDGEIKSRLLDLEDSYIDVTTITDNEGAKESIDYQFSGDYRTELREEVLGELKSTSELNLEQKTVNEDQQTEEKSRQETVNALLIEDASSNATTTMRTPSIAQEEITEPQLELVTESDNLIPDHQTVGIRQPEQPNESVTEESNKRNAWIDEDITTSSHDAYAEATSYESAEEQSTTSETKTEEVPMSRNVESELNAEEQMITEARLAKEDNTVQQSLNADTTANATSSQTSTEEPSKTWLGSLFRKGYLMTGRQTVEPAKPAPEEEGKINSTFADNDLNSQTLDNTNTTTGSVSAMIHSVTSWIRKSSDSEKLDNGGTDVAYGKSGEDVGIAGELVIDRQLGNEEKQMENGDQNLEDLEHLPELEDEHLHDGYFKKTYGGNGSMEAREFDVDAENTSTLAPEKTESINKTDGVETGLGQAALIEDSDSIHLNETIGQIKSETSKSQGNVDSDIVTETEKSQIINVDTQEKGQLSTENQLNDHSVSIEISQEDDFTEKVVKTTPQPFLVGESESLALD